MNDRCNIGKAFALTYEDAIYYLDYLQRRGKVTVSLTAGLDSVELESCDSLTALEKYYKSRFEEDSWWTVG